MQAFSVTPLTPVAPHVSYVRSTFIISDDDTLLRWSSSLLSLTRNCVVNKLPAYMNQYPAHLTHEYTQERSVVVTHTM